MLKLKLIFSYGLKRHIKDEYKTDNKLKAVEVSIKENMGASS